MGLITGFLLALAILWVLFVNLMGLKRAAEASTGTKRKILYAVGYPLFLVGYVYDGAFNITYGSLMFMELPFSWTLTARMKHHIKYGAGWRRYLAVMICRHLVEPWDVNHCRLEDFGQK